MSDDELTEKILDSIKTGLRNAIQTDIYKDNQSPEERKLNEQLVKIQQEIKNLLNEYIDYKEFDDHIEGLIDVDKKDVFLKNNITPVEPDLEQIMVYIERSKKEDESFDL